MFVKKYLKQSAKLIVTFSAAVVLLAVSHSSAANAQGAANTLKVSPVRSDVQVDPGQSTTVQTVVTNLTNQPITVRPIANDFVANDESGTPALILDENQFAPSHSLKRFMSPFTDVTIPAGQAKTIKVTLTVPADAAAGGYFGAVRFAPTTPDNGGQVNLSASVASLILLTVSGSTNEKLDLSGFEVRQNGHTGTHFGSSDNLEVSARFTNGGDIQLGPFGKISVMKGDKVVYETDFNNKSPRDVVLPDSSRRWNIPLNDIGGFGEYKILATFTYGAKNQTVEVTKSFWIIPTWLIISAVAAVLVLIGGAVAIWFWTRRSRHRRRALGGSGRMRRR